MGRVYRAKLIGEGRVVALKVLRAHLSGAARKRFDREARILAGLDHPTIVAYVGHGEMPDGSAYLAMELLRGETLKARLKRGVLTVADTLIVAERLVHALSAAHQHGIVHRDLKPANIHLIDKDIARIKLLDFGIARQAQRGTDLTQPGTPIGTPAYMSPEQVRGEPDVDARSDLYSLGCLLFRCLAGRTPLTASDAVAMLTKVVLEQPPGIEELRPGVPAGLSQIIAQLLSKQREERPPSAASLLPRLADVERPTGQNEPLLPSVLTAAERRVRCLILVGADGPPDPDVTIVTPPRDRSDMSEVEDQVEQHGGTLHALADGSLVVTMTGASAATDLAIRAARCALRLRPLFPAVSMALATGRAEDSVDSLIGDVIERGAAALRFPCLEHVRIDDLTAQLLRDRFVVERDEHGAILSTAAARSRADSSVGRSFVGRRAELSLLGALLADTVAEPLAQVALVTGDAGIGKSRLLQEVTRQVRCDHPDIQIWRGSADAMNSDTSLYALSQLLRHGLGIDEDATPNAQRQQLLASFSDLLPAADVARVAAFVGEAIGLSFAAEFVPSLGAARNDDSLCREHMQRALLRTLSAAVARGPLLLIVEDVHWCSPSTVQLLDVALRELADEPLFLLASARPQVHERFRKLWHSRHYQELRLRGLRRAAAHQLLRARLGDKLSEEAAARVVDSADGNPFYLEALLRDAAQGRLDRFPDSVLTAASAELERLPSDARRLLRAASVFGSHFSEAAVLALLGAEDRRRGIQSLIDLLIDQDIIVRQGDGRAPARHAFRHALYRQAAYAMLIERDRQLGHRLAARQLERAGEQNAMLIAQHLERGGHIGKSLVWYERAARQALRSDDLGAAAMLVDRALSAAPPKARGRLLCLKSEVHRWRGANGAAYRASSEALDGFAADDAWWFVAAGQAAAAASKLGAIDDLIAVVLRMVDRTPEQADPRYLQAAARAATPLLAAGRYELVNQLLEPLSQFEPPSNASPSDLAWLQRGRSMLAWCRGDVAAYLRCCAAGVTFFEEAADSRNACSLRLGIAIGALHVGDVARAEAQLTLIDKEAAALKMSHFAAVALQLRGHLASQRGEVEPALAMQREAAAAFRGLVDPRNEGTTRVALGRLLLEHRGAAQAEEDITAAVALLRPWSSALPYALAVEAALRLVQERMDEALALGKQAYQRLNALGRVEQGESYIRLVYAQVLRSSGDHAAFARAAMRGKRNLQARAARITDVDLRNAFLRDVQDNRALAELVSGPRGGLRNSLTSPKG